MIASEGARVFCAKALNAIDLVIENTNPESFYE
jgi:hypothetical protein